MGHKTLQTGDTRPLRFPDPTRLSGFLLPTLSFVIRSTSGKRHSNALSRKLPLDSEAHCLPLPGKSFHE
ncbi:hypothetical protein GCM10007147_11430 [Nocardiopsis kunsanensis]|uniref:Uncharacterized protein n=1 Tax=Nocardiopsis kunsanensis TaxID=141693 RepID=A0A918X9I6_9ACTN|nr:hypothetical protein GCM10007147_11430 [Nocardiopsis kunsanensis]